MSILRLSRACLVLWLLTALSGCAAHVRAPKLGGLYDRVASYHGLDRNPVIVIPGVLGSRLVDPENGQVVWGAFSGDFANPETAEGARLVALPMAEGVPLGDLRDDVVPDGALDRITVSVLGLPIELNAYLHILGTLGVGGYRDELLGSAGAVDYGDDHYTCFQFDYDWRRDIVENAQRLDAYISEKQAYVKGELEKRFGVRDADVQFDLVCHSMGGLVARYYLRYGARDLPSGGGEPPITWAGAKHVERVILVGTPSAGSVLALEQLVEGVKFAPLIVPTYEPAVLGTMPAIYQLLPRPRHDPLVDASTGASPGDLYDPGLWERMGWGLAAPDQDRVLARLLPDVPSQETRRRIALDHLAKCLRRAERLAAALDAPASRPAGLDLYLFAGDAVSTPAVAEVSGTRFSLRHFGPGDGTVLRTSALMDERLDGTWAPYLRSPVDWTQTTFLFTNHLGMTRDPAFTDNVLYLLLEDPR